MNFGRSTVLGPIEPTTSMGNEPNDSGNFEALADDFLNRRQRGEDPSIEEYYALHPEHVDEISLAERWVRWSRRNKGLAASLTAIPTLLLIGFGVSIWAAGYYRWMEGQQRELVKKEKSARITAARQAANATQPLYENHIALPASHLRVHEVTRARANLNASVPERGASDRCGWEWYVLDEWANGEQWSSTEQTKRQTMRLHSRLVCRTARNAHPIYPEAGFARIHGLESPQT